MKKTITQATAQRAKPAAKPYQLHDTMTPGFILRVQPSGKRIWKLVVGGRAQTLGHYPTMTVATARTRAERILNGDDARGPVPTLDQFIDQYYAEHVHAHHSRPDETLRLLHNFKMGDRRLDQVRAADIERYRTRKLGTGIKESSINRYITTLKTCLQKAVTWELIDANPLARIKPLKLDQAHVVRYLSPGEEERMFDALCDASPWLRAITTLALQTGLRKGELFALTWADVDLKRRLVTVHGGMAKSGQTRHVPLNATAMVALREWRGDVAPMPAVEVFGQRDMRGMWKRLLRDAGVESFTFHCCRHHFASKLVMASVDLNRVRELLGHGSLAMTLRYSHLAPDTLHDAVELIG